MRLEDLLKLLAQGESETVEFKRSVSNDLGAEICAFANAQGGYILIGVDDSGKIIGIDAKKALKKITGLAENIVPAVKFESSILKIDDKEILVLKIPQTKKLSTLGGIAYIRVGTSKRPLSLQEILALGSEYTLIPLDSSPTEINAKEMSKKLWAEFLEKRKRLGLRDTKELKEKLGIVKKVNGKKVLTFAGALMFLEEPQQWFPHTYVRFMKNGSWIRISGPLWKMIEDVEKVLLENLPKKSEFKGFKRSDEPVVPIRALREAVINALVHRNYAIYSETFIELKGNFVKIRNPGSFPPGVSPENPKPVPRNPIIYELMFETGYVEKQGSGIEMIKKECASAGVKVTYKISQNFTEVIFEANVETLNEPEKLILNILEEPLGTKQIAEKLGISKPTAIKYLKNLEKKGFLQRIGSGRWAKWKATFRVK